MDSEDEVKFDAESQPGAETVLLHDEFEKETTFWAPWWGRRPKNVGLWQRWVVRVFLVVAVIVAVAMFIVNFI